jgi:hypothetical protein
MIWDHVPKGNRRFKSCHTNQNIVAQEKTRARWRKWYQLHKNDPEQVALRKKKRELKRKRARDFIRKMKSSGCSKCGFQNVLALQFHHLNPKTKKFNIANFRTYSLKRIKEEIDKCVVLCANCHLILHRS